MHKLTLVFKTVVIENIGAYFGTHEVTFPHGERNMLMIRGDNTAGKTSFMNGLKWCLFDQISSSKQGLIDPFTMYNARALRIGSEHPMRVTIEAEYDNAPITIERKATWRFPKTRPQSYEELDVAFTVTRYSPEGVAQVMSQDESEKFIGRVAPPILGRFFLFDGELLDEYRDLVSQSSSSNPDLGKAIDGVLGLPVLDKAQKVLDKAIQIADKQSRSLATGVAAQQHTTKIEGFQAQVNTLSDESGVIEDQIDEIKKEINEIEHTLDSYKVAEENLAKRDSLQSRIKQLTSNIEQHRESLKAFSINAWHDLAYPALKEAREALLERSDQLAQESEKEVKRDHLEALRREILKNDQCSVCLQSIDSQSRDNISILLDEIDADRDAQIAKQETLENLIAERKTLQRVMDGLTPIKNTYKSRVERIDEDIAEKQSLADELDEMFSEGSSVLRETIDEYRQRLTARIREQGHLEAELVSKQREISSLEGGIQRLQEALEKEAYQGEKSRIVKSARHRLVVMRKAIEAARERQAEAMRQKVEEYTSHAYRAMTHEKHHKKVQIAPKTFGMTIIDSEGQPVMRPSAGATQILALSLIISLGQIGRKLGPLVMDTPLGRLDLEHRINVLEYLPKHSHQVAMLYHAGEIDDAIYQRIQPMVGQEYLIVKDEGESTSRLEAGSIH